MQTDAFEPWSNESVVANEQLRFGVCAPAQRVLELGHLQLQTASQCSLYSVASSSAPQVSIQAECQAVLFARWHVLRVTWNAKLAVAGDLSSFRSQ